MVTKADVYRFMADPRNNLAVLGSCDAKGRPQGALVGIGVTEDLEIIFDTVKSSRKYANLIANPRCSFVCGVAGDATVQFEGEAREVPPDSELVTRAYYTAFPDGPARLSWPGITYFAVKPDWVRYSDYGETPAVIEVIPILK